MTRGEGADLPSIDTPSARSAGRRFWINTVSLDHVEGAIEGGFTQADHGANTRLHRPRPGDLMVFYSPRTNLHGGIPVRQFAAILAGLRSACALGEVLRLAGANRRVRDVAGRKSRSWPGSASATAAALNVAALAWVSVAGDQVIPGCRPGRPDVMGVLPWRAPVALPSARLAGWLVRWRGAGVRGRASRVATSWRVRPGA
jgi:hypothetical protein